MVEVVWIANDNIVNITGLTDEATGLKLDTSVVTCRILKRSDETEVAGTTWPITAVPEGSLTGNYTVDIPDELTLAHREDLLLEITAIEGSTKGFWKIPIRASDRES